MHKIHSLHCIVTLACARSSTHYTHRAVKCSVTNEFCAFYLVLALIVVLNLINFSKVLYHLNGLETSYNRNFLVF